MEIDMEKEILFDYVEFLENFIISNTNINNRYNLYIDFILEHLGVTFEGS